jgi:GTP-binding protein
MQIKRVKFISSMADLAKLPEPTLPEYAFIGRSNVGKSSLINALTGNKSLAYTSSNPGKTQTINHYIVDEAWYLVDLPGYGYARVSQTQRAKFAKMIHDYMLKRKNIMTVFVLVDSRIEPQASDLDFIQFLGENAIPFAIVFTKTDKGKQGQVASAVNRYKKKLEESWEELPKMFLTSAVKGKGVQELIEYIGEVNPMFANAQ